MGVIDMGDKLRRRRNRRRRENAAAIDGLLGTVVGRQAVKRLVAADGHFCTKIERVKGLITTGRLETFEAAALVLAGAQMIHGDEELTQGAWAAIVGFTPSCSECMSKLRTMVPPEDRGFDGEEAIDHGEDDSSDRTVVRLHRAHEPSRADRSAPASPEKGCGCGTAHQGDVPADRRSRDDRGGVSR